MANYTNIWNRNHNSEIECVICKKKFKVKWSQVSRRKCCSRKCKDKWHSICVTGEKNPRYGEGVIRICKFCNKEYRNNLSRNLFYCSSECYHSDHFGEKHPNWKGGKPHCKDCGKKLSRKKAIYCAKHKFFRERNPNWQGGISIYYRKYGFNFTKELKELIRRRDDYKCIKCGKEQNKRKLAVHHKDDNKRNNDPQNLESLCCACHRRIHKKYDKRKSAGKRNNNNRA